MITLSALLLLDLVVGVLDLTRVGGLVAIGPIGGAGGIVAALVSFRAIAKFVDSCDTEHGELGV